MQILTKEMRTEASTVSKEEIIPNQKESSITEESNVKLIKEVEEFGVITSSNAFDTKRSS